ncbi:MAG: bifunctional phosphopantothenoylcysteine decarboxylase/phosphopantothenate--cysteine ligase CoaBC [Candidatus Gastranaerophilales bacterium]|nr:bifunctional phosphopantothenoylcysteine decarboxylase/phosphopantothenate--cysteine ligase CoaBC [Candidatus Gastranaerophilales bacterium]
MVLSGKKILVGITGGIAAYKTCELIRLLIKAGAEVKAVMTPSAKEFVTETTIRTLTRNQVYIEQFPVRNWQPEHISLADSSDLFIIAPASANTIGKIANGICDNLLTSLVTAFKKPVILAPAMNCNMWESHFVQKNVAALKKAGFCIVPPESGELACGYEGTGRMASVDKIFNFVEEALHLEPNLKGKKIIITAGGTKEPIDPVRFIGNRSSGKMGIALADAAFESGAEVSLITTVDINKAYKVTKVDTALEMLEATKKGFVESDILIMVAAVADYRPKTVAEQKIKKENSDSLTLELVKNPDILMEISKIKKPEQTVVGFCAESENLFDNALKKLKEKNLDYIVANDISDPEIGFNSDYNAVTLIDKNKEAVDFVPMPKKNIAKLILKGIVDD